jgi:6-phosphogluconolactonase
VIEKGVREEGFRTLVLAGGSTPQRCYALLVGRPIEWGRVTVLFGDERCVPPDDPESNYRMAFDTLLAHVAPASVHRMPGELGAEAAAAEYERVVRSVGNLDLVLLGLGEDGHTASLFPGHPELSASGLVTGVHGAPKPPPDRVSLTLEALNAARRVVFLATGAGKREAFQRAQRGEVPAGMVGGATWIVDSAVAG